jgi:phosphatidylglycerophosphate synthase
MLNKQFENYVNLNAIENNKIMFYLYKITFPLSLFFFKYKIFPNTISTISLIFAILSCIFLINNINILFILFWIFSMTFDFCDGTVSRLMNLKSNFKFNIDHYFDLLKITLILISITIKYKYFVEIFYLVDCILITLFFIEIVNNDLINSNFQRNVSTNKTIKNNFISIKGIYTILFSFNAHTLILFSFFCYSFKISIIILIYISILLLKNLFIKIYQISSL